jgi:hypothetical protein
MNYEYEMPVDPLRDLYPDIESAIGLAALAGYRIVDTMKTKKGQLISQGYTLTLIVRDSDDRKHTIHHNPTLGLYAGDHKSSGRDN